MFLSTGCKYRLYKVLVLSVQAPCTVSTKNLHKNWYCDLTILKQFHGRRSYRMIVWGRRRGLYGIQRRGLCGIQCRKMRHNQLIVSAQCRKCGISDIFTSPAPRDTCWMTRTAEGRRCEGCTGGWHPAAGCSWRPGGG